MKNFTRMFYGAAILLTVFFTQRVSAQCVFFSTDGYSVTVSATPVAVIAPSTCPDGYNYNLTINYNVSFSGINIPANLYTLQGKIYCDGQDNFFSLPVTGGSGTVTSVSNPYRSTTDCASATVNSLKCNRTDIIIQGPGMPYQTSTCINAGPLPITLVSFNAKLVNKNTVYLKWVTANETGNRYFIIERSSDARNWKAIQTIAGALNSTTTTQYEYTDEDLAIGTYYYRLKQADISGAVTYSTVIGADITKTNTASDISLTTSGNQLYFTGLGNSKEWEMFITGTTGVAIARSATLQSNIVQLPTTTSAGIYIVRLRNIKTGADKTIKFFKY